MVEIIAFAAAQMVAPGPPPLRAAITPLRDVEESGGSFSAGNLAMGRGAPVAFES
jgi:hypothetical protein